MNAPSPQGARTGGFSWRRPPRSLPEGTDDGRDLRWNVRARARAILAETSPLTGIDWDSVSVIAEGITEDIEAAT